MKQDKKMIVCFLTPLMVFFVGLYVYPIIRTIVMSFYQVEAISDPVSTWKFVGLENFKVLLNTSIFQQSMMNMIKIWLMGGIIVMFFAILFAVILTSGVKFKNFYRAVIYIPNIINAVAISTMWMNFVYNKRFGLLHTFFKWIGADNLAKIDYMNGNAKFYSLLVAFCFGSVGYFMLILMSGIEQLPGDMYEAATIDGASKPKQFFHITLPLLRPMIILMLLMSIGRIFNSDFGLFYQVPLNSGLLISTTQTIDTYVYRALMQLNNVSMSSAASVFQAVIGFVLVMLSNLMVRIAEPDNALF